MSLPKPLGEKKAIPLSVKIYLTIAFAGLSLGIIAIPAAIFLPKPQQYIVAFMLASYAIGWAMLFGGMGA